MDRELFEATLRHHWTRRAVEAFDSQTPLVRAIIRDALHGMHQDSLNSEDHTPYDSQIKVRKRVEAGMPWSEKDMFLARRFEVGYAFECGELLDHVSREAGIHEDRELDSLLELLELLVT